MDEVEQNGGAQQRGLAYVREQPLVEVQGRFLPACHILDLDAGHLLEPQDDDTRCQYVRPNGQRCKAPRLRDYGICLIHAGGGPEMKVISAKGHAAKARFKLARQTLGIGVGKAADPRMLSRIRAQARAEEIAEALLAPLDDSDLSASGKQRSAVTILDALWPQQTVSLTVELPQDEAGVQGLTWQEMQALAAQLLGDTSETPELEPA